MARSKFAGGVADQVFGEVLLGQRTVYGEVLDTNGDPAAITLDVYDEPDGTQLTDLLAADGTTPITEVVTAVGTGLVPAFYGPDGVTTVYLTVDEATFFRCTAAVDEVVSGVYEALEQTESARDEAVAASTPLPPEGSLTYDGSGNVIEDSAGVVYTYNADNTVDTITYDGETRTLTYNADGTIGSVA